MCGLHTGWAPWAALWQYFPFWLQWQPLQRIMGPQQSMVCFSIVLTSDCSTLSMVRNSCCSTLATQKLAAALLLAVASKGSPVAPPVSRQTSISMYQQMGARRCTHCSAAVCSAAICNREKRCQAAQR